MDRDQQVQAELLHTIDGAVAYCFGMTIKELHDKRKTRAVVVARRIASYLMKRMAGASLADIGRHFGGQHRSTVRCSVLQVETLRCRVVAADLTVVGLIEDVQIAVRQSASSSRESEMKVLSMRGWRALGVSSQMAAGREVPTIPGVIRSLQPIHPISVVPAISKSPRKALFT
jgi:hypothetical protein